MEDSIARVLRMAVVPLVLALIVSRVDAAQGIVRDTGQAKKQKAIDLNLRSGEYYNAGKFKEAAELLRQAYRLNPNHMLMYNLGCACESMADYACAIDAYEKYLQHATPNERQNEPQDVQQKIVLLRKNLSEHQNVERRSQKEIVKLKFMMPQEMESKAGSSEKAGVKSLAKTSSVNAGDARRKTGYILDAAGGAVLAGGAIVGLLAWKAASDARSETDKEQWNATKNRGETLEVIADGLLVAGAATLGVGLYYTFSPGPSGNSSSLAVMPAPSGGGVLVLSGKF